MILEAGIVGVLERQRRRGRSGAPCAEKAHFLDLGAGFTVCSLCEPSLSSSFMILHFSLGLLYFN